MLTKLVLLIGVAIPLLIFGFSMTDRGLPLGQRLRGMLTWAIPILVILLMAGALMNNF